MYILYSRLDFFLYTTKDPEIFEFVDIFVRLEENLSDNVELLDPHAHYNRFSFFKIQTYCKILWHAAFFRFVNICFSSIKHLYVGKKERLLAIKRIRTGDLLSQYRNEDDDDNIIYVVIIKQSLQF
jgi:hypothetical protein